MIKNTRIKGIILVLAFVFLMSSVAFAAPVHKDLLPEVSPDNIYNHIAALVFADEENPNGIDNARVTGFEGEYRAADYIAKQFQKYGLEVERQEFPVLSYVSNGVELKMVSPEEREFTTRNFDFTPDTTEFEGGELTAEIVHVGLGYVSDYEGKDVEGKIALISRGDFTFFEKAENAAAAGAVGAIIYNNATNELDMIMGTLGSPTDIPVVAMCKKDGLELAELLKDEIVVMTIKNDTSIADSYSQNIIATLKATGNNKKAQTIIIGAHYDSVDCPGANDNASGTATMLEIARVLSKEKLAYNIKFIAFGAEEVGLNGSYEYVESLTDEELDDILAMINMDMVGVGNGIGVMTATNRESFVADLAEVYIQEFDFQYERSISTASDHAPFDYVGIPVVFLNYGPDPYYHTDEDSLDKISKENLYNMGSLVTTMTYDLAKAPSKKVEKELKSKVPKSELRNTEIPEE
ncbi:aminopeptidase YwaD [Anaerovirgula multivorans]|uniref:Aminopeptidase YwaD n=1 Tax=Anaerovirgula multivorans TaxID=312168 RepID=A0A239DDV9_9FIRM|nr:M20/M25/M40 family metallo-hydrolase [Anaerovirgula multivorans]SNS30497.1 aminopeptidase YwaD [Anaerovirgula multivorans]